MADIIREYNRLRREEMRTSDPVRLEEIRKEDELNDRTAVRKLTGLEETWCVTCEYHTRNESRHVFTKCVIAENIFDAIIDVAEKMEGLMEKFDLSDYHILGANIVPELH